VPIPLMLVCSDSKLVSLLLYWTKNTDDGNP
jgi:hypothetical protein